MSKKLFCLALVGMLMGLVGSVGAVSWDDGYPSDHLWSSPQNWSSDSLPTSADDAYFDVLPRAVLDATLNPGGAFANNIRVGSSASGELSIIGGAKLTLAKDLNIAYNAGSTGTCYVDGSDTLVIVGGSLKVGRAGNGTLVMNNGTINVTGNIMITATNNTAGIGLLQLDGGTITAAVLEMRKPDGTKPVGTGTMDVTGGTLILTGDMTTTVQGYIDNGWITAYGGLGTLLMDYDVTNSGKTTLTAILPEPATMALLGLGSLALYRRKKN